MSSITLYEDENFEGSYVHLSESVYDLEELNFDDETSSIKIYGEGTWMLYQFAGYKGKGLEGLHG